MKHWKHSIACLTLAAMMSNPSHQIEAKEYCVDTGGGAYEAGYQTCCLAPAIALAVVLLAGIIAVGVHNRSHSEHAHDTDTP